MGIEAVNLIMSACLILIMCAWFWVEFHMCKHDWSTSVSYDYDFFIQQVLDLEFSAACVRCGKEREFKEGSSKYEELHEAITHEYRHNQNAITRRAYLMLEFGREVDIVTGEPLFDIKINYRLVEDSGVVIRESYVRPSHNIETLAQTKVRR